MFLNKHAQLWWGWIKLLESQEETEFQNTQLGLMIDQ